MKNYSIKKVLVPIDFSNASFNALETAIYICKRQLSTLTLIHVVEDNAQMLVSPQVIGASFVGLPDLITSANDRLNDLAKDLHFKHDVVVDHVVQCGRAPSEICRIASDHKIDLIVMGMHGASGIRQFVLGSTAYRVVKHSLCPVMTIPEHNHWIDFKRILFPVRMVFHALDKYEFIKPIIRKNSAELIVAGLVARDDAHGLEEMDNLVGTIKEQILDDEVACEAEVHYCDNITEHLLSISELERPDLIVITATLNSSLKEFFLGPYTENIVNHSNFPVLSINPEIMDSEDLRSME